MIVACSGMPRSGSTLQFNIIKHAVSQDDWIEIEWVKKSKITDKLDKAKSDSASSVIYFKTHHLPKELLEAKSDIRFLTSIRDPRDVAASNKIAFNNPVEKTVKALELSYAQLDKLVSDEISPVYISSYSNLISNLEIEIQRIANFLNVNIDEEESLKVSRRIGLEAAYNKSHVSGNKWIITLKRKLLFGAGKVAYKDSGLRLHPNHISKYKGRNNYYNDVLDCSEIKCIETSLMDRYEKYFQLCCIQ